MGISEFISKEWRTNCSGHIPELRVNTDTRFIVYQCTQCGIFMGDDSYFVTQRPDLPEFDLEAYLKADKLFFKSLEDKPDDDLTSLGDYFNQNKKDALQSKRENRLYSDYTSYLKSPEWKSVRQRIIERDKSCVLCNSTNCFEVHHRTYEQLYSEHDHHLTLLCSDCHMMVTDGLHKRGVHPKR